MTSDIEFDWNDAKSTANLRKHNVGFLETMSLFANPLTITDFDNKHSEDENRFVSVGRINIRALVARGAYVLRCAHDGEAPYSSVCIIFSA